MFDMCIKRSLQSRHVMLIIRNARPDDAERIAELYKQLVSNPEVMVQPGRISAISGDPNTGLFVCELSGEVQGTALVSLCADVMFGSQPFAVIENVVVDEDVRGQGLGEALLRHIEAFCLASNCSKMMLLSSIQREDAHRFFERAGFAGSSKRGFVKYRRQFQAGA
jgi:N-acetylglutamate synthase-like GNAT family acetyltransferase